MLHVIDVYQTDKSIVVAVEESDSLADLKKRITSRHVDSPAPSAQRLVAGGKELTDLGISVRVALGVSWRPRAPPTEVRAIARGRVFRRAALVPGGWATWPNGPMRRV